MGFQRELKFVEVGKPGRSSKPGDEYALRSHVRRMIALDKASRPQKPTFRFVSVSATALGNTVGRKKQIRRQDMPNTAPQGKCRLEIRRDESPEGSRSEHALDGQPVPMIDRAQKVRDFGSHRPGPLPSHYRHPFATIAADYVDLPIERLDALFKCEAFRHAAEPLFDITHVDSVMNMSSVFPLCLSSHAFLNALVYSIVQALNRGKATLEQLKLKSRTVTALHESIVSGDESLTAASVGTIMILRGVAYKWEDYATHDLHAKGLAKALQNTDDCLTPTARRALFWQDLFASILISAPRALTHHVLPEQIHWKRCQNVYDDAFPRGFLRHRAMLPDDLLACVQDLVELQAASRNCTLSGPERQAVLDPLQAHIESRLALQSKSCETFGLVASSTRLALFIITYTSHMSTWDFSLIPGRLAEQLVVLLELSLCLEPMPVDWRHCCIWSSQHDLLLWLLLVGGSAAALDGGVIEGLAHRYTRALDAYRDKVSRGCWSEIDQAYQVQIPEELSSTLRSALEDFVLTDGWVESRLRISGWFELELLMDPAFLSSDPGQGLYSNPRACLMSRQSSSSLPHC